MAEVTTKLVDLLGKDDKAVATEERALAVERASLQVNTDILAAKGRVTDAKKAYNSALITLPFNPAKVINAKRALADAEQDISDLESLKSLF